MNANGLSSGVTGVVDEYWKTCKRAVSALNAHLGGKGTAVDPASTLPVLQDAFEKLRSQHGGADKLAALLHINREQVETLSKALRRVTRAAQAALTTAEDAANAQISALKLLNALECVEAANPGIGVVTALPGSTASTSGTRPQQQVRALELIIRSLITEAHGDQQSLRAHFIKLNKAAVEKWERDADKGDLLSGSMLGDLISMFVNKQEYPEKYAQFYKSSEFLSFLENKRATLEDFLRDIQQVRNRLAHHKRITPVQIALLDLYYEEIVAPLQLAHDSGRTSVNPDSYFDASEGEIKAHFDKIGSRLDRLGEHVDDIKHDLSQLTGEIRGVGGKLKWIIVGLIGVGAIGLGTLGLSGRTLGNTEVIKDKVEDIGREIKMVKKETSDDPRKELANRGVQWTENNFSVAAKQNDLETVKLFLQGGFHWKLFNAIDPLRNNRVALAEELIKHVDQSDIVDTPAGQTASGCNILMGATVRIETVGHDGSPDVGHDLTDLEKRFLRKTCSRAPEIAFARQQAEQYARQYRESKDSYDKQVAAIKPPEQCYREMMADDARVLRDQAVRFNPTGAYTMSARDTILSEIYLKSMLGARMPTKDIGAMVDKYCHDVVSAKPNIYVNDWPARGWKQVLDAIN